MMGAIEDSHGKKTFHLIVGVIEKVRRGCHGKSSSWVPLKISAVQKTSKSIEKHIVMGRPSEINCS